ncbi:MAG: hypothetical protein LUC31_00445, partial [Coprobacillus sp.]|nr:hypothetical protein [Coprobacillus sp.]
ELADALDLGSSGVTRAGSIPVNRTKKISESLHSVFYTKNGYKVSIGECFISLDYFLEYEQ